MNDEERLEDQLRQKISSKMTVSTFLAGFNITALTLVLTLLKDVKTQAASNVGFIGVSTSALLEAAAILFFLSAALFVAAVYSYDVLLMPQRFYLDNDSVRLDKIIKCLDRPKKDKEGNEYKPYDLDSRNANDKVFAFMMFSWSMMFIPATLFSALGIFIMFSATVSFVVFLIIVLSGALALIYYQLFRPKIALD